MSVVRSLSIPEEDVGDFDELAKEFGGYSKFFREVCRALLAHRAAQGVDPTGEVLAIAVYEAKARKERDRATISTLRAQSAEQKAAEAKERARTKLEKKRDKHPTPEALARAHAYMPEGKLRALAAEYEYDPAAVVQIALGIRRDEERREEMATRPEPATYEEWIREGALEYGRLDEKDADRLVARMAKGQGFDTDRFVAACRAIAGLDGQSNLDALAARQGESS